MQNDEGFWLLHCINEEVDGKWIPSYFKIYLLENSDGLIAEKTPDSLENIKISPDKNLLKAENAVVNGNLIFTTTKKISKYLSKKEKRQIFKIQDAERSKVYKDIHDSVVQNIRTIRLEAEMLDVQKSSESKKQQIVDEMTNVITLLRNLCYNLSPAELSLAETSEMSNVELLSVIDTLSKQFAAKTKIPCSIKLEKDLVLPELDVDVCKNIVRVVQEAFANIEKHSFATRVQLLVKKEIVEQKNKLVIYIIDDGVGCDVNSLTKKKTPFGIRNMIERTKIAGSQIEFFSEPNEGLSIRLSIPYEKKSEGKK